MLYRTGIKFATSPSLIVAMVSAVLDDSRTFLWLKVYKQSKVKISVCIIAGPNSLTADDLR